MKMGRRIRKLRRELGMSQTDVAYAIWQETGCRLSVPRVSEWERNVRAPKPAVMEALAKVLETTVADLVPPGRTKLDHMAVAKDSELPDHVQNLFRGIFASVQSART